MWENVLYQLTLIGFDVVVNDVDGHSANRKFYKEKLCEGVLKISIPHPFLEGARYFLLFDKTHVFKCIYNNFVNKKEFKCPDFNGEIVTAHMKHIEELYKLEMGQPVKIAYKLTKHTLFT